MALRKAQIQIQTIADTSGATKAAAAMSNLNSATGKAATGTRNIGAIAGQAGFQIQDFAVQVGAGTSALTAFSQQAPQFLGAFGSKGAIAGALIAIGAIATKVFLDMGDDAQSANEKAEEFAETLNKIGEEAARVIREDVDFGQQRFEAAQDQAEQYRDSLRKIESADDQYTESALQNAEKIKQAVITLLTLQGKQIDQRKLEEQIATTNAEKRQRDAQAAIQAEEARIQKAREQRVAQEEALRFAEVQLVEARKQLQADSDRLAILREQRDALKELEGTREIISQYTGPTAPGVRVPPMLGPAREGPPKEMLAEISQLEAQVEELDNMVRETSGKLSVRLQEATDKLATATVDEQTAVETARINIERITEKLQTEDIVARANELQKASQAQADLITKTLDAFVPANETQKKAVESLLKDAEDRQIQANESLRVSSNLQLLTGNLTSAQREYLTQIQELLRNQAALNDRLGPITRDIKALRSKIENPGFIPVR